jgi:predicted O-linked N-acetylglucosamine transferase (SPINDLY family)
VSAANGRFERLFAEACARQAAGDGAGAADGYRQCLSLDANVPEVYNNLGTVLEQRGQLAEAIESFRRALALRPDYVRALNNLGKALRQAGQPAEAWGALERALDLSGDNPLTLTNLGFALIDLGRIEEALTRLRAALARAPDLAEAHHGLALALLSSGDTAGALAEVQRSVTLKRDLAPAHFLRGRLLLQQGAREEAVACIERAVGLAPQAHCVAEALQFHMSLCDWDGARRTLERLQAAASGVEAINTFVLFSFSEDPAEHLRSARAQARLVMRTVTALAPRQGRAHEKLRVGYLSADYRTHATTTLVAELFELHDRSTFEIFGVSFGPTDGSAAQRRIESACHRFVDLRQESDREIARWLREQEIDIAVDLKGYTAHARSGVLACRPAPVQVSYLGYPGTMGAPFIDYLVADEFLIPEAEQQFYQEKIAYLPDSYQANDRRREDAAATPARSALGLPDGAFVFCCFNNNWKITEPVFEVWMRLLSRVGGSVLWLLADNPGAAANLRREAAKRGVAAERIVFCDRTSTAEHLARHRLADLFLDTLPVNAHTTASDALWMGLPIVTCAGRAFPGRVAGSLLRAVRLDELVAGTLADYEQLALRLASDPARLREIRGYLERERLTLPLFDTPAFCRHLESAYRHMWMRHCEGKVPETFRVERLGP